MHGYRHVAKAICIKIIQYNNSYQNAKESRLHFDIMGRMNKGATLRDQDPLVYRVQLYNHL